MEDTEEQGFPILLMIVFSLVIVVLFCIALSFAITKHLDSLSAQQARRAATTPRQMHYLAKRRELIASKLIVREWVVDVEMSTNTSDDESAVNRESVKASDKLVIKSDSELTETASSNEDVSDDEALWDESSCPICFSPFKKDDLVCESNNFACIHVFHKDCVVPWLEKHEECPLCRNTYILETE